jgi:hypothetical protein
MNESGYNDLKLILKLDGWHSIRYNIELVFLVILLKYKYSKQFENLFKHQTGIVIKLKLKNRFIAGSYLGYTISRYVTNSERKTRFRENLKNGVLYGYWGLTIITLDYLIDSLLEDPKIVKEFTQYCINRLSSNESASFKYSNVVFTQEIIEAKDILDELLSALTRNIMGISENNRAIFVRSAVELLNAQLYSMKQKDYSEEMNFKWYWNDVLNQKTLNFFLAPINLFCNSITEFEKLNRLRNTFLALNKCYWHWQLIDDVADLIKDSADKIISAPGYIVISQGQLSQFVLTLGKLNSFNQSKALDIYITESRLLESYLPFAEHYSPEDNIYLRTKISLSNTADDLNMDLKELLYEKIEIMNTFIAAHFQGNADSMISSIRRSRACKRILSSTFDPKNISFLNMLLKNEGSELVVCMKTLHSILHNTYSKALLQDK